MEEKSKTHTRYVKELHLQLASICISSMESFDQFIQAEATGGSTLIILTLRNIVSLESIPGA